MLSAIAQVTVIGFVLALLIIVLYRLMTGTINLHGLLKDTENKSFSPGRLQLLLVTVGSAIFYFSSILSNPNPESFPPVPAELLLIVGASNAGYLSAKAAPSLFAFFGHLIKK